MIDWLTVRIGLPRPLPGHINGGQVVRVDEAGNVERSTPLHKKVMGSYESSIQLRAPCVYEIEISGNPAKFVQGHNLYGTDCPVEALWRVLERIDALGLLGAPIAALGLTRGILPFCTRISRIDLTGMLMADSLADVRATLRAMRVNGRLRDRGKSGLPHPWDRGEGVTFGGGPNKSAQHRSITFYSKGLDVLQHPLPDVMMDDADVRGWTEKALRCEARLGAKYLAKSGLRSLENWTSETALTEWHRMMERIDMNATDERPDGVDNLPPHLRATYGAWVGGEDPQSYLKRPTFYRHRSEILKATGVDIAIPRPKETTAKVVPIRRIIELQLAGRPEWADRIEAQLAARAA